MNKSQSVEIIAKGRGLSFARNSIHKNSSDGVSITFDDNWQECLLGILYVDEGVSFPLLIYPDGEGVIALAFETQDENGNWKTYDLTKLQDGSDD